LELDWDANEVWRWEHEAFHHDMCRLPNGNTLVLIWEALPEEMAKNKQIGEAFGVGRENFQNSQE
jgi:hypothetical protein